MTTWSQAKGRKVVSVETAVSVGKLDDLVLDPAQKRVAALVLGKTPNKAHLLPWDDITGFGDDAITIASAELIVAGDERLAELADKKHSAEGKRVLTSEGEIVGEVKDLEFESDTGTITSLILKDGTITADDVIAVGSWAVMVKPQHPQAS